MLRLLVAFMLIQQYEIEAGVMKNESLMEIKQAGITVDKMDLGMWDTKEDENIDQKLWERSKKQQHWERKQVNIKSDKKDIEINGTAVSPGQKLTDRKRGAELLDSKTKVSDKTELKRKDTVAEKESTYLQQERRGQGNGFLQPPCPPLTWLNYPQVAANTADGEVSTGQKLARTGDQEKGWKGLKQTIEPEHETKAAGGDIEGSSDQHLEGKVRSWSNRFRSKNPAKKKCCCCRRKEQRREETSGKLNAGNFAQDSSLALRPGVQSGNPRRRRHVGSARVGSYASKGGGCNCRRSCEEFMRFICCCWVLENCCDCCGGGGGGGGDCCSGGGGDCTGGGADCCPGGSF